MEDNSKKVVDYRYIDKTCFAIMPFGIKPVNRKMFDFNAVYHELIEKAVTELGLKCERCDEINIVGSIHKTMFRKIFDADVAIVDITSQNPNVFYELGVRHALRKCVTIVICKSSNLQKIPFNINGLKIIGYEVDQPKQLEEARKRIVEHIEEGLSGRSTDSLVHDNLEDLKVEKTPKPIIDTKFYLYELVKAPDRKIGIITGDIQNVKKVDVWVNSENTNMQMSRHYERSISGTIRYLGAKKNEARRVSEDLIANELTAKVGPSGAVDAGAVIATGAGELTNTHNVKKIFHAASVQGQIGRGYRPIPDIYVCVRSVLELADSPEMADAGIRSILFPLMGTGQSGLSAQDVTDKLIDTAISYLEQCEESKVKEVYFLAYSEQDLELCKHKFIYDPKIRTPEGTL